MGVYKCSLTGQTFVSPLMPKNHAEAVAVMTAASTKREPTA